MNIEDIRAKLRPEAATLKRFGVASLGLFGSVARDEAGPSSDVDVIVRFESEPTYDRFMDLKFHLEHVLGARVDLVTERALRPELRNAVERDLKLVA